MKHDISVINTIKSINELSSREKQQLNEIIHHFKSIDSQDRLGLTQVLTHTIDTFDAKPIRLKQFTLLPNMQEFLNKEIDNMSELAIIETNSPWCSPLWLVKKKSGDFRVRFDGKKLNQITVRDSYPMPRIDSILSRLRDSTFVSSIDLKSAFFQVPLDEPSRPKTAFAVYGKGLF